MSRFTRHLLSAAAITIASGCASSTGTSSAPDAGLADPAQAGLRDPKVVAKLRDLGLQASSHCGVPSPKTMVAVAAPDNQVAQMVLSGGSIPDHSPVYIIVITGGTFTCNVSHPPGVPEPQGNVITLILFAATYSESSFGISNQQPDLDKIGSPQVDLLAQ
jgi:hypothetical protein